MRRIPAPPHALALVAFFAVGGPGCGGKEGDSSSADTVLGGPSTGVTDGGSYAIEYETEPSPIPLSEPFILRTRVTDPAGRWIDDATVVVNAEMPTHGHGMNTTPTTQAEGDGWYRTEGMLFHMPGDWQIVIDVTVDGALETSVLAYGCCITDA